MVLLPGVLVTQNELLSENIEFPQTSSAPGIHTSTSSWLIDQTHLKQMVLLPRCRQEVTRSPALHHNAASLTSLQLFT